MLGTVVAGRYRVVRRVGAGGMAEVYEADDVRLPRKVALKFLSPGLSADRQFRVRFEREGQAISSLDHPHICTVYEVGESDDGRMFIAMAFYQGESLRQRLARGKIAFADAAAYGAAVADGMAHAHRKGILHRDLKPGNVLLTEDGVIKVVDFGLAKLADRTQLTRTGAAMGTLAYAAPEQVEGLVVDARGDIYSLGVLLYEMITGVSPFEATTPVATLRRVLQETPAPAGRIRSGVPRRLEALIARSMAKDPARRPASMLQVRDELIAVLAELDPLRAARAHVEHVDATPAGSQPRLRWLVLGGALAFAALLLLVARWEALRSLLGLAGASGARGIAVLPLQSPAGASSSAPLAAGLWLDLTDRVDRLSDGSERRWVLPPWRCSGASADDAGATLGIEEVLTGVVGAQSAPPSAELRLEDAASGKVRHSWRWSPVGSDAASLRELAGQLGLHVDATRAAAASAGYSDDVIAYNQYLRGLGALGPLGTAGVDTALAFLASAVARDSTFLVARLRWAEALYRKGNATHDPAWYERAVAACQPLLQVEGLRGAAHALLGQIRSSAGDKPAGIEQFRLALGQSPRNLEYRRLLAGVWMQLASYDSAEATYRAAIRAQPGYLGGYESLGYLYRLQRRHRDAIAQFQQVTKLAPRFWRAYNYLGGSLYELERWDEARAMFEKSFALQRNFEACANLGTLYYMDGRFEDAARMYEWAWEYDQSNHMVAGNLASALHWLPGQGERARRFAATAIELAERKRAATPDDPLLLSLLAGYYSLTDSAKADAAAQAALQRGPDHPEVLFRVALAYEELGQRTKALKSLGDALQRGYPMQIVAHERQLQDLRADPRYKLLLP